MTADETRRDGDSDRGTSLSRRTILAGLGTVGGFATVGSGTLGLMSDSESAGGVSTNVIQAGELDLRTCWERPGEDCAPDSTTSTLQFDSLSFGDTRRATLRCELVGNPGWLWLRTGCPDDACGLERGVDLTVWYDDGCDGSRDAEQILSVDNTPIEGRRLCDALGTLHGGIRLDGDRETSDPSPLQPGDTCCLGFEFDVGKGFCLDETDSLTFDVDLFVEQRRHRQNPPSPPSSWVGDQCDVDCTADCPPCRFQEINFAAFCIESGSIEPADISFTPYYDIDGHPYRLDWNSRTGIDWVVLNYDHTFENFRYDGATSGSVHVESEQYTPANDNFDSKLRLDDQTGVTDYGQCSRDPCPNLNGVSYGCGVKYNFDDGTWSPVCRNSCTSETNTGRS